MKRADAFSAVWLALVLAGVIAVGGVFGRRASVEVVGIHGASDVASSDSRTARAGAPGFARDATGRDVPIRAYQRIASASALADQLLIELAEPERVIAFSHRGKLQNPERHRFGARVEISGLGDLERLIALRADLLVVNHLGAASELERARSVGIEVFDLGEMRGLSTLEGDILSLARLLGDANRGQRLWARTLRRMRAVAADVPVSQRKSAMYLAVYAGKLFGGTRGTSYHDVLIAAGLIDLAAVKYRDWPQFDPEQLLELDPPLIVTDTGMTRELCSNRWLQTLAACRDPARRVVELPPALIGDPGLLMLDAAERLHDAVYTTAQ